MYWLWANLVVIFLLNVLLGELWNTSILLLYIITHGNEFANSGIDRISNTSNIVLASLLHYEPPMIIVEYPIPPRPRHNGKGIKDVDSMIEKYIQPLQGNPVEMLEIGLGCDMPNEELGASYYKWLKLLPGVELDVIEADSECVEKFERQAPAAQLYVDKLEPKFNEFQPKRRRLQYDIVVDRGLITIHERVTGFLRYWNSLSPGGLYIMENLSWGRNVGAHEDYGDLVVVDPRLPYNIISGYSSREYVYAMLDDMMKGRTTLRIGDETVECLGSGGVCVIQKK